MNSQGGKDNFPRKQTYLVHTPFSPHMFRSDQVVTPTIGSECISLRFILNMFYVIPPTPKKKN